MEKILVIGAVVVQIGDELVEALALLQHGADNVVAADIEPRQPVRRKNL